MAFLVEVALDEDMNRRELLQGFHPPASQHRPLLASERKSLAISGPNRLHHIGTVSWQRSVPRSNNWASTFLRISGYLTYIITTNLNASGEDSK